MNTILIYNETLRYANSILSRRFPDLPEAERKAAARRLAKNMSLRKLAEINLRRQAAKHAQALAFLDGLEAQR